jgi:pyridoxal phosphate enzyme (YggS family)
MINPNFQKRLSEVQERIDDAAQRSGRSGSEIQLVAVTKYVDTETTRDMFDSGAIVLGENRPQVLEEKAVALAELPIEWHMIGNLQRNKVKRTVAHASMIHSVDRNSLLDAIEKAATDAEKVVQCLLEINVSGESTKHGYQASELREAIEYAITKPSIRIEGLMCMAGLDGNLDDARREFALLRELRDQHADVKTDNVNLTELSMGMSGDFEIAIEEGATLVRVGSVLYGS